MIYSINFKLILKSQMHMQGVHSSLPATDTFPHRPYTGTTIRSLLSVIIVIIIPSPYHIILNINYVPRFSTTLQECDFFIGMSSLFCNFAIFSNKKYVIFKNPEHHCIEMERELGLGESFNFADDKQIFIRKNETVDLLSKYFNFITRISTQK